DHGESLGEHRIYFDHAGLYEPTLRVPLIVWAPGRVPPGRHRETARGLDVAPTVLRLAGLPVPRAMQGRDLFGSDDPGPIVAEGPRESQIMFLDGGRKLISTLERFTYSVVFATEAGQIELFD